ncbi:hypothetical protein CDV31_002658 [Fusarium ambrosium]|uniref:Uncharacterized protein n=1 Tax=Fusarium ambrosium TaxID=131363 RepID=A0A428UW75_9HYPO|nr:hypothetical protein CDV31_002658 [Fusarium ambrosium]
MRRESAALAGILTVAQAQSIAIDGVLFAYQTATITECFPMGGGGLEPTLGLSIGGNAPIIHRPAVTGQPIIVEVDAPRCDSCGCDTCVHTEVYTLTCDAFCNTGLCKQAYVVTETYSGMTAKPTLAPTDLPFGFTCDVQTCTWCGPEPITATITYPLTERLYVNKVPAPTGVPGGSGPGVGGPGAKKPAAYSPSQDDGAGFHYESDYASGADSTGGSNSGSHHGGSGSDADSDSKGNSNGGSYDGSDSGSNAGSYSHPESGPGSSSSSNDNSHHGSDSNSNANSDSGSKAGSDSYPGPGSSSGSGTQPGSGSGSGSQPGSNAGSQPGSYPGSQSGSQPGSQPGSQSGWQPGPGTGNNAAPDKQNTGSDSASNNSPELPPSDDRPVYVSSASKSIVILTLGFSSLVSFTFLALISL